MYTGKRKRGSSGYAYKPKSTFKYVRTGSGKSRVLSGAPGRTGGFYGMYTRRRLDEKKFIDVSNTLYNFDTTGTIQLLNGCSQATDYNDRIGRKIIVRSIQLRGLVYPLDTTTATSLCRMILLYDCQTNGAAPAITDVITSATSTAPLNLNNRDRFKILMDKQWAVAGVQANQAGSPTVHQFKKFKKYWLETIS